MRFHRRDRSPVNQRLANIQTVPTFIAAPIALTHSKEIAAAPRNAVRRHTLIATVSRTFQDPSDDG